MKKSIIILILIFLFYEKSESQCGCCSAAFSGSSLAAGTSNVGVLKEGSWRVIGLYRNLYGTKFFNGTKELRKYYDESLNIHYSGLNVAYGFTKDFTLETEIGAFPYKNLNFGYSEENISGFSSLAMIGKFTILADKQNSQEITIGGGARLPLSSNTTLGGNFGIAVQIFYFKSIVSDLNLILYQNYEFYIKDSENYQKGNSWVSSLFLTKGISEKLTAIFESRFEILTPSFQGDEKIINTGKKSITIVPQISFNTGKFSVSGLVELPLYKDYEGVQLSEKIGSGIAVIVMI
jgi:hypothetical protein